MSPMDAALLRQLYFGMLRIRIIEERIAELYYEQEMRCPVHLCIGQEAVSVGVCENLSVDDYVMSGHRSHGHYLAKGGDLPAMMAEMYGKVTGCCQGRGGSMHLLDRSVGFLDATAIVGSTIPMSVGAARASVMKGEARAVVSFFGEAACEEGVFHESLNFAALERLPVVFVCENNLYSVYSPLGVRQPEGQSVIGLARGHGIESYEADGNDVVEVYNLSRRLIQEARGGGGPRFVEFKTYRWREHCGPAYDNELGYRTEVEFQQWKARCPIEGLETRLLEEGILSPPGIGRMRSQVGEEIEDAVVYAKQSSFPDEGSLMEDVYAP